MQEVGKFKVSTIKNGRKNIMAEDEEEKKDEQEKKGKVHGDPVCEAY